MKIRLADGSGFIELRHLVEDVDRRGNVRVYYRRKGQPKVRLHAPFGSTNLSRNIEKLMQASHNSRLRQMCAPRPGQAGLAALADRAILRISRIQGP